MMSAMLIAGAIAVLAGLGAIALGIPVKEFSFGNTMILSGTIGVCTGLILLGLSAELLDVAMTLPATVPLLAGLIVSRQERRSM